MLRITVHHKPLALTFQLEGRLAGPWLQELEECWQSTLARKSKPILRVDLTEVTFIDAAGKTCLAALHRQGAEFLAADCLIKAVVDEITQACLPGCEQPKREAEKGQKKRKRGTT
jgi:anti-anti-sigma regulatory factor